MYEYRIGIMSEKSQKDWKAAEDPFDVISQVIYSQYCTLGYDHTLSRYFHDRIQVDWGSFAWKATLSEVKNFFFKKHLDYDLVRDLDPDEEYAVVFIEMY